ncbi:hypothetical protein [Nostoc sp.]|uniref:hypothetical protein n=1 Tax=Nostoc sp. TaxID=1180 RepID=UPI002FFADA69
MSSPVLAKPTTSETSYVLLYNVSWEQLEQLDVALAGTSALPDLNLDLLAQCVRMAATK